MKETGKQTLFITDLDGTLLTPEKTVSIHSAEILNRLMDQGMLFSIATARSAASTVDLLRPLRITLPIVLMNGVFLYDLQKETYLDSRPLPPETAERALSLLRAHGKTPFLYRLEENSICVEYEQLDNEAEQDFYQERAGMVYKKFHHVERLSSTGEAPVVYLTMIDTQELLEPVYCQICQEGWASAAFYHDNYSDYWYLEIYSKEASKESGARAVMKHCGASRLVAFGDNMNDVGMLSAADEGYAVANAQQAVKKIATKVIETNSKDGVAKFLTENYIKYI